MGRNKVIGMLLILLIVTNLFNPLVANAQDKAPETIRLTLEGAHVKVPETVGLTLEEANDKVPETVVLTLKEAEEKALQNVDSINQINRQLRNLLKRNNCTFKVGEYVISDIEETINSLYVKLKNGNAMYSHEVGKLFILYTMYGDTVYFSGKEDITKYMNPNFYPKYSLWANVMKQSIISQNIEVNIKNQTRLLYDSILSLREQQNILKISFELQKDF